MDRSCKGSSGVNEMHSPSRTTQWDVYSPIESLEWHPSLLVPIVPLVPMDHRNCPVPSQSHGKIIEVPSMRCIFTNRTIGMTSFSIGTNPTIGTNGPSVWRIVSVCVYWTFVKPQDNTWPAIVSALPKKKNWEALRSSSAFFYMMTTGTKSVKKNNNWKKTEIITSPTDKDAGFSMLSAVQSDHVLFFMATIVSTKTLTSLRLGANFKLYIFKLKVCNLIESNFREQAIHVSVRHLS